MKKTKNPYMGVGTPAEEERFVGRSEILQDIEQDLLAQSPVSLVGLARIGKTSLGRLVLKKIASENSDIQTARIQLNEFRNEWDLWNEILTAFFQKDGTDGISLPDDSYKAYSDFRKKLREKKRSGFKGVLLLDEFDRVIDYDNRQVTIDRLRELACDQEKYGITVLFISRRSLARIQEACAGSTLFGICQKYYLRPFDITETKDLIARSNSGLGDDFLNAVYERTGGYPYLLESFMKEFYNLYEQSPKKDLNELYHDTALNVRSVFTDLFDGIKKFLTDTSDNSWESLCAEFIPPKTHENPEIMQSLKEYGLIRDNTKSSCLSETFRLYIQSQLHHLSTWEPLVKLEQALRGVVKDGLTELYTDRWFEEAPRQNTFYEKLFSELRKIADKEQRLYNLGDSSDLLEYSYPGTLKDIILQEWDYFGKQFGNDKLQFKTSMDVICVVRNPLAHGRRTDLIPPKKLLEAKEAIDYIDQLLCQPRDK